MRFLRSSIAGLQTKSAVLRPPRPASLRREVESLLAGSENRAFHPGLSRTSTTQCRPRHSPASVHSELPFGPRLETASRFIDGVHLATIGPPVGDLETLIGSCGGDRDAHPEARSPSAGGIGLPIAAHSGAPAG